MAMSIRTRTAEGVACIELARPERKNAINLQMYGQLADAFEAAAQDPAVRAVVIHGAREIFCAGNDIADFLASPPQLDAAAPTVRFMQALAGCPVPVIAAVNGAAVGIGTTLLLHCDLAYAADDALFSMPFVSLGLCPEFASSLLLSHSAGYHRAAEKLLLGEPISAEEALEMGIVNRLLPPGEVLDYALRQARRFNALPPRAVRATKRLLKEPLRGAVQQTIAAELQRFGELLQSAESREALQAFLERRKPDFTRAAAAAANAPAPKE